MSNENDNNDDDIPIQTDFKKILVVDDILYVVKSISKILRDEGYFVITAKSGYEAIDKFEKYSPDLVTVDQKLPDMMGFDLVKRLRELAPSIETKIVFISAVTDKETIQSILNLRISQYLIKPFKRKKLLETIKELIG